MTQMKHRRVQVLLFLSAIFLIAEVACTDDDSGLPTGMVQVDAPIESVEIIKAASKSPNPAMIVAIGLRNGCEVFDTPDLQRDGDVFRLTISNLMNVDPERACTDGYRTVTTAILLEAPIKECKKYVIEANGVGRDVLFTYTPFMELDAKVCGA